MAAGDLTCSTGTVVQATAAAIKTAVDAINLAATTDHLFILPVGSDKVLIFKVERAA